MFVGIVGAKTLFAWLRGFEENPQPYTLNPYKPLNPDPINPYTLNPKPLYPKP